MRFMIIFITEIYKRQNINVDDQLTLYFKQKVRFKTLK